MHDEVRHRRLVRRVAYGSVAAFATYIAGAGLTYCSQLLIARIVGVHSFGIYAYVFAWMTVLAYFSALGFDVALLRFVPAYQGQQAWALLRGVIQYAERRAALVGICVILIGTSVITIWARSSSSELTNTFLVGFVLVPVLAVLWVRCSVTRAFGGVVSALAPNCIVRDGILLGLVGLASLGRGWNIDATLVMVATLISSVIGLGLASLAMRWLQPRAVDNIVPTYAACGTWRRTALPLLIINAAEVLMNRAGVMLLGWLGETREAGIYALAFNIAFLVVLPRTAVNIVFAPTISDLFARQDRAMLQVLVARAASWTLCGAACIALALWFLAEPILAWSGNDFGTGVPVLRILLIGQVFAAGAGSQLYLMTMSGHERSAAVMLVSIVTVNALAGAALISLLGLNGAAISFTATLIIWNVAMAFFVWRRLRLFPGPLAIF
jgi:O-antigen/teichoic acid export membrane protein